MKPLLLIFVLVAASLTNAQSSFSKAEKELSAVEVFAFGGTGFAGITSQGEKDFRIIVAQPAPAALQAFERLFATGNAQAKAYALAGIRRLDKQRFEALIATLQTSQVTVETMSGCIRDRSTLVQVAKEIKSGSYDF